MCARGDLQHISRDTYTATLTIRIFRAVMTITTTFDLNTRQYNAINAFSNANIDKLIYIKLSSGFKGSKDHKVLLLLLRALYELK